MTYGLEAMRQAADAAIAVVPYHRREDALRALDPEDATRRNGSRPAIRRCRRDGSFDAADPDRNVANGRDRAAAESAPDIAE